LVYQTSSPRVDFFGDRVIEFTEAAFIAAVVMTDVVHVDVASIVTSEVSLPKAKNFSQTKALLV